MARDDRPDCADRRRGRRSAAAEPGRPQPQPDGDRPARPCSARTCGPTTATRFEQGFWAVAVHRFGNWRMGVRPKLLRAPFSLLYRFLFKWVEWTCGITLPYTVRLGRRVRIWHHGGMVLHARSIGDDVQIRQNTTFGIARRPAASSSRRSRTASTSAAARASWATSRSGDDSVIGANAVVLDDVPPRLDGRRRRRPGSSGAATTGRAGHERARASWRSAGTRGSGSAAAWSRSSAGGRVASSTSTRARPTAASSWPGRWASRWSSSTCRRPFSAARARNAGFERLLEVDPGVRFVQFVDGDCEVVDGWLEPGRAELEARPEAGGRLRPSPRAVPRAVDLQPAGRPRVGHAASARPGRCGGDAMMRVEAFEAVGGFDPRSPPARSPSSASGSAQAGWTIFRVDAEMTRHDLAMTRFGQWWRRQSAAATAASTSSTRFPGEDGLFVRASPRSAGSGRSAGPWRWSSRGLAAGCGGRPAAWLAGGLAGWRCRSRCSGWPRKVRGRVDGPGRRWPTAS